MNAFLALIRRERWEHQALWIVPAVFAALMVVMHFVGLATMARAGIDPADIRYGLEHVHLFDGPDRRAMIELALVGIAVPFNLFLVGLIFFYSLGCLYDERRDRSILFWKSMPVSDVSTVASKLVTATLLAPALTLLVLMALHVFGLVFGAGILMWAGAEGWYFLLDPVAMVLTWAKLAWLLFAQSLVLLPIIAWLMLASAWAKKAPFLWALVPPAAVMIFERWMMGRSRLAEWLGARFTEVWPMMFGTAPSGMRISFGPGHEFHGADVVEVNFAILLSGQLWFGIAIAAVLLAGAVWLRRYRAEAE